MTIFYRDFPMAGDCAVSNFGKLLYINMVFIIFNVNFRSETGPCLERRRRGEKARERERERERNTFVHHQPLHIPLSEWHMHNTEVILFYSKLISQGRWQDELQIYPEHILPHILLRRSKTYRWDLPISQTHTWQNILNKHLLTLDHDGRGWQHA